MSATTKAENPYSGDPGVNLVETMAVTEQEREQHTGDEDPFEKTYVAIDGIEADEIADEDAERLERAVVEFMLNNGYEISGARVISKDKNVIEFSKDE